MDCLAHEPGWKEWQRKRIIRTLDFDDPFLHQTQHIEREFVFSNTIEKQHAVVIQYLGLQQTLYSLKECEYYFRRFPFRGLPITRYDHVRNVCEMYFGRFYELKERIKKYFNAIKQINPDHGLDFGRFIKKFEREFDQELRARNSVNHHRRFEEIGIERIMLVESILQNRDSIAWRRQHLRFYRKAVGEWVQRVRAHGSQLDEFLEAIAEATLSACTFLTPPPLHKSTSACTDLPSAHR
jgi:hypothetical protein